MAATHAVYVCVGKLQVDAAAAANVKVFQFSTQEDVEKRTKVSGSVPLLAQLRALLLYQPRTPSRADQLDFSHLPVAMGELQLSNKSA